jgi:AcrR family transcriptional regulator
LSRPRLKSNEQLLDAARRVFLEHGPRVSTVAVAQAIGVSQALLFQRFGTKEGLLLAALMPGRMPWMDLVEAGPDHRPLAAQLRQIALRLLEDLYEVLPRVAVLRAAGLSPTDVVRHGHEPPPVAAERALGRWFAAAQASGRIRADVDARHAGKAFFGCLHVAPFMAHMAGDAGSAKAHRAYVETVVEIMCRSLQPKEAR